MKAKHRLDELSDLTIRDLAIGLITSFRTAAPALSAAGAANPKEAAERGREVARALNALLHDIWLSVPNGPPFPCFYGLPKFRVDSVEQFFDGIENSAGPGWDELRSAASDFPLFENVLEFLNLIAIDEPAPREEFATLREGRPSKYLIATQSLAAASRRTLADIQADVRRACESEDELAREVGWRLRRTDVPLIYRVDNTGVLVGLDVQIDASLEPGSKGLRVAIPGQQALTEAGYVPPWWRVGNADFENGIRTGIKAARDVLAQAGMSILDLKALGSVHVNVRGVVPPSTLEDGSAGLPIALSLLSEYAGLPIPPVVSSGKFDRKGQLEPMPPEYVIAKGMAVDVDGVNSSLLAYAPQFHSDSVGSTAVNLLQGPSLEDAALAVWGESWVGWKRDKASALARATGWRVGFGPPQHAGAVTLPDGTKLIVPSQAAPELLNTLIEYHPVVACLAGPPRSGKTWAAQEIHATLRQADWSVIVLTADPGLAATKPNGTSSGVRKLNAHTITAIIRSFVPERDARRLLVILDGLEADDQGTELEQIRDSLQASVLGLLRHGGRTAWHLDDFYVAHATSGKERIQSFLEALIHANPILKSAEPLIGSISSWRGVDAWWAARLLVAAASQVGLPASYEPLLREFINERVSILDGRAREEVTVVAALSLFGIGAADWVAGETARNILVDLGATFDNGYLRLANVAVAEALLSSVGEWREKAREVAIRRVSNFVYDAIQRRAPQLSHVVYRLGATHEDVLGRVFSIRHVELVDWLAKLDHAPTLARMLSTLRDVLATEHRPAEPGGRPALPQLVGYLADLTIASASLLAPEDLSDCLDILRQYRGAVDSAKASPWWEQLLVTLEAVVPVAISTPSRAHGHLKLVDSLIRLQESRINRLLLAIRSNLLTLVKPYGTGDFTAALRLHDAVVSRLGWSNAEVSGIDTFWDMAKADVTPEHGVERYVTRIVLRQILGIEARTPDRVDEIVDELPTFLQSSSLAQIARALSVLATYSRSLAVEITNRSKLASRLEAKLHRAEPSAVARFVAAVERIHGRTAFELLYRPHSRVPRQDLVAKIARRIRDGADVRGAGQVLRAAISVDEMFADLHSGFAASLVTAVGPEFFEAHLRLDQRTLVIYHVMEVLTETGVELSGDVLDSIQKKIAANLQTRNRPGAARLALLLLDDWSRGERLGPLLQRDVSEARILEGMQWGTSVEGLGEFHRLGNHLYPAVAKSFREQLDGRFFARLERADSPEVTTRTARIAADTLRRAGAPNPGSDVAGALGDSTTWKARLVGAKTPGDFSEAVRDLTRLSPGTARQVVADLQYHPRLLSLARSGLRQPSALVELLEACEEASPSAGKHVLDQLHRSAGWNDFLFDLRHEQNPRTLGTCFHRLAGLGFVPSDRIVSPLTRIWTGRIREVQHPTALSALLAMFAAWDRELGTMLVSRIDIGRLCRRMSFGGKSDLRSAAVLVGALHNLDGADQARQVAEVVISVNGVADRLGVQGASPFLAALRICRSSAAEEFADMCQGLVSTELGRTLVNDDVSQWLSIGWLAYQMQRCGVQARVTNKPWTFDVPKDPSVRLWGAGWLAPCPWTEQAIQLAVEETTVVSDPAAAAVTIAVAAEHHQSVAFEIPLTDGSRVAVNAGLHHVAAMVYAGNRSDTVRTAIETQCSAILSRLAEPSNRTHLAVEDLRALLGVSVN